MAEFGLNHIPFGLRESDGAIIDVYAVQRGRGCGCICPSCQTPLIARQGEEKVWHFAHASRNVYDRTAQECDFSFYVSVRFMARQLIGLPRGLLLLDGRNVPSRGSVSACAQQVRCSAAMMRAQSLCNRLNSATASLVFATLTSIPTALSDSIVFSGTCMRP